MRAGANPFSGRLVMSARPQNIWGMPHSIWFFSMGVGGALYLNRLLFGMELGRVMGLVVADALSMILIGAAGLILISDLGRPFRFLRALMNPRTSWISVGAICDFIFLILDGLWLMADLEVGGERPFANVPWAGNSLLGMLFQGIAGIAAFIVIVYPGLVLAYSPSIPFWNTTLLPLQYLAFAFASAVGLALVFAYWNPVPTEILGLWATGEVLLLSAVFLLVVAHLLNGAYGHSTARLSVRVLVRGDLKVTFVWGTLVCGVIIPLLLSVYGSFWSDPGSALFMLGLSGVITIPGNWLSKYVVIRAGFYAPFL